MEPCTVADLRKMEFDKNIQPIAFWDGALQIAVDDWTDLSLRFVHWLIQNNHLSTGTLPVDNHARCGKYFINGRAVHKHAEKDGLWKQVGPYYVDTKYNAGAHIKNILSTLDQLGVTDPHFSISFNVD